MATSPNYDSAPTGIDELRAQDNVVFSKWRGVHCFDDFQRREDNTSVRAAISYTGGKDCHLALQRCQDAGLEVVCGAMFFAPGKNFNAHRMEWQRIQGDAMGIPIVDCFLEDLDSDAPNYQAAYAAAIRKLQSKYDIQALVTGDIDFVGSSTNNFMQRVCTYFECSGVKVLLPLWQQSREELLKEMINKHQFDIRLCCVKTPHFDESWIGRRLDQQTMDVMRVKIKDGLDLTGENGEYHTMVVNGPMYKNAHLNFIHVKSKELLDQRGMKPSERWWVIDETAELILATEEE